MTQPNQTKNRSYGPRREAWGDLPPATHFEVLYIGQRVTAMAIQKCLGGNLSWAGIRWDQLEVVDLPDEEAHLA